MRNRFALVVLLVFEVAALATAWYLVPDPAPLDRSDLSGWLTSTPPDAALLSVGRLVAIGLSVWLLASSVLAVVAQLAVATSRVPTAVRQSARLLSLAAPPTVRRLVEATVAVGILSSVHVPATVAGAATTNAVATSPASARALITPLGPVRDGRLRGTAVVPATATATATEAPAVDPSSAPPARHLHVVRSGESLWSIARDHLAESGVPSDSDAVDLYWHRVCEANRAVLRSGDVNLVHPGEAIDLPPVA